MTYFNEMVFNIVLISINLFLVFISGDLPVFALTLWFVSYFGAIRGLYFTLTQTRRN